MWLIPLLIAAHTGTATPVQTPPGSVSFAPRLAEGVLLVDTGWTAGQTETT